MLALAAAFVPIILLPMVMELRTSWVTAIDGLSWLIWGVFAAELTVRTYLSDNRLRYLRRH